MKKQKSMVSRVTAWVLCSALVLGLLFLGLELTLELIDQNKKPHITVEQAEKLIETTIQNLPAYSESGVEYAADQILVSVEKIEYGKENKAIYLDCRYETLAMGKIVKENANALLCEMYLYYVENNSVTLNAGKLKQIFAPKVNEILSGAEKISGTMRMTVYEKNDGTHLVYLSDETVDTLFGGLLSARKEISEITELTIDEEKVNIANLTTLRNGFLYNIAFGNYDSEIPETGGWLLAAINELKDDFKRNFIEGDRWLYLFRGLGTTLAITGCSMLMGVLLGFLVAVVRVSYEKNGSLPLLNGLCKAYLSVIRGTPVMIQLLIIYFVLLAPLQINKFVAAVICFGINSGAYVAEIVRGGIMSVDGGQIEAGRSLGLNYSTTMLFIVFPQAFKAVLPSLANEFIVLLKETSVAFYIGVSDLTQGGLRIRSVTYSNFMPLIAVALIYWVLVVILTKLVSLLERRLRQSER